MPSSVTTFQVNPELYQTYCAFFTLLLLLDADYAFQILSGSLASTER